MSRSVEKQAGREGGRYKYLISLAAVLLFFFLLHTYLYPTQCSGFKI